MKATPAPGALDTGLSHLEPDDFVQAMTERLASMLAADYAAVFRLGVRGQRLHAVAAAGLGKEGLSREVTIPLGWGFAGKVFQGADVQELHDITSRTVVNPVLWEKGIRSIIGIPLQHRGEATGVVGVGYLAKRHFSATERERLAALSQPLAAALKRQRDLERGARRLIQSERQQEFMAQVLRMMGHDLKSPLTAIKLQHELLHRDPPEDRRKRSLAVARRNVERLELMLDDLLDLARAQAGKLVLQSRDVDLATVARDIAEAYQEQADRKGIDLRIDLRGPLMVRGDERRLSQVLANLVSNALRYTPDGGRIGFHGWQDQARVGVTILDSGQGMSAEQLADVGKAFASSRSTHAGGTGLGLHISKIIVEEHGGTLTVSSTGQGRGTRADVALPRPGPGAAATQP